MASVVYVTAHANLSVSHLYLTITGETRIDSWKTIDIGAYGLS